VALNPVVEVGALRHPKVGVVAAYGLEDVPVEEGARPPGDLDSRRDSAAVNIP
jgi:hypothetical protein